MCKHARLAVLLASLSIACGPGPRRESTIRVSIDGGSPVAVQLSLSAERASQTARWTEAVAAIVRTQVRMMGEPAAAPIVIRDQPTMRSSAATDSGPIEVAAPLWSSQRGMAVEAAVARAMASALWHRAIPCVDAPRSFVDGVARYTAITALADEYDGAREPPSTGMLEARYAGAFLPWVLSAAVPAWTAGPGVAFYRAHARVDPRQASSAGDREAAAIRTALALRTLATWIGGPTWDAVLRSFAHASAGRCGSPDDLKAAALQVTGLDLSWFFDEAWGSRHDFDYAVDALTSTPVAGSAGRFHNEVSVGRRGEGVFSGTNDPPLGPFESGRGVEVAVHFADGSQRTEHWDGRARSRRFVFEGPAVESAVVDPRQVIALDTQRTDNSRTLAPRAGTAASRWATLWSAWLEHLLLTYASLV